MKLVSKSHAVINNLQFVYVYSFHQYFKTLEKSLTVWTLYGIRDVGLDYQADTSALLQTAYLSEPRAISRGVPQSSRLSPLLVLIFVNDHPSSSQNLQVTLFADDSTPTCRVPDAPTVSILASIEN